MDNLGWPEVWPNPGETPPHVTEPVSEPELPTGMPWYQRHGRWLRGGLGAVLLAGALYAEHRWDQHDANSALHQIVNNFAASEGVSANTIMDKGLGSPNKLPGENVKVSLEQENLLKAATVVIMERPKGTRYWHENGTGTKVSFQGKSYILSAAHLFDYGFAARPFARAVNILPLDGRQFALADPYVSHLGRMNGTLLGSVTAASYIQDFHASGPDISLLQVKSAPAIHSRNFDSMPSIPLERYIGDVPKPGEQAYVFSVPSSAVETPVGHVGTYLGHITLPYSLSNNESVNIVGLKVKSYTEDACDPGGSGSSSAIGANFVGGSLYGHAETRAVKQPLGLAEDPAAATSFRLQIEEATHLQLKQFSVLCIYNALPKQAPEELVQGLTVTAVP